jgi:hypothetical protein
MLSLAANAGTAANSANNAEQKKLRMWISRGRLA